MGGELLTAEGKRVSGIPRYYDELAEAEMEDIEQLEGFLAFDIEYRDTLNDLRRRKMVDGWISLFRELLEDGWGRVAKYRELAKRYRKMGIE